MASEHLKQNNKCGTCLHLGCEVQRKGLKPYCKKNKIKFKSRETVEYGKDTDLNSNTCDEYEYYYKK